MCRFVWLWTGVGCLAGRCGWVVAISGSERDVSSTSERPAGGGSAARPDGSSALRFAAELVAWIAAPWALATHSPVLAGVVLLLLIGLPTVFATPGDKTK